MEVARLQEAIRDIQSLEEPTIPTDATSAWSINAPASGTHDLSRPEISHDAVDIESPSDGRASLAAGILTSSSAVQEVGASAWRVFGSTQESSCGPMGMYLFPVNGAFKDTIHDESDNGSSLDIDAVLSTLSSTPILKADLGTIFLQRANKFARLFRNDTMVSLDDFPNESTELQLLHSAILAIGANFCNDLSVQQMGLRLTDFAQSLALSACVSHGGLDTLRGLIAMSWLALVNGKDLQAWMYNSMASGLVGHLGLHVLSEPPSPPLGTIYLEKARTFWVYEFVDRMASATLGRLPTVQWRHVQTPRYQTLLVETAISIEDLYFDHICELWRLFDIAMDVTYAPSFRDLSQVAKDDLLHRSQASLSKFYGNADQRLHCKSSAPGELPFVYYFNITFHTSLLLLNRPFLSDSSTRRPQNALKAMAIAATEVGNTIKQYRRSYSFADAPLSIVFHITRSSIVFLLLATSSADTIRRKAAVKLKQCLEALDECSETWEYRSKKSIRLLQELAARWKVVRSLPLRYSNPLPDNDAAISPDTTTMLSDSRQLVGGDQFASYGMFSMTGLDWSDLQVTDFSWLTDEKSWEHGSPYEFYTNI
jgi:hypothetical protein